MISSAVTASLRCLVRSGRCFLLLNIGPTPKLCIVLHFVLHFSLLTLHIILGINQNELYYSLLFVFPLKAFRQSNCQNYQRLKIILRQLSAYFL